MQKINLQLYFKTHRCQTLSDLMGFNVFGVNLLFTQVKQPSKTKLTNLTKHVRFNLKTLVTPKMVKLKCKNNNSESGGQQKWKFALLS